MGRFEDISPRGTVVRVSIVVSPLVCLVVLKTESEVVYLRWVILFGQLELQETIRVSVDILDLVSSSLDDFLLSSLYL